MGYSGERPSISSQKGNAMRTNSALLVGDLVQQLAEVQKQIPLAEKPALPAIAKKLRTLSVRLYRLSTEADEEYRSKAALTRKLTSHLRKIEMFRLYVSCHRQTHVAVAYGITQSAVHRNVQDIIRCLRIRYAMTDDAEYNHDHELFTLSPTSDRAPVWHSYLDIYEQEIGDMDSRLRTYLAGTQQTSRTSK
jgi:hypothetical protein